MPKWDPRPEKDAPSILFWFGGCHAHVAHQQADSPNIGLRKAHPIDQKAVAIEPRTRVTTSHVEKTEPKTSRKRAKIEPKPQFRTVFGVCDTNSLKRAQTEPKTSPKKGHAGWGERIVQGMVVGGPRELEERKAKPEKLNSEVPLFLWGRCASPQSVSRRLPRLSSFRIGHA